MNPIPILLLILISGALVSAFLAVCAAMMRSRCEQREHPLLWADDEGR